LVQDLLLSLLSLRLFQEVKRVGIHIRIRLANSAESESLLALLPDLLPLNNTLQLLDTPVLNVFAILSVLLNDFYIFLALVTFFSDLFLNATRTLDQVGILHDTILRPQDMALHLAKRI